VPSAAVQHLHGETMGTTWSVSLVASPDVPLENIRAGIQHELDVVNSQMSTRDPASDLCAFNRAPADSWQVLPAAFFNVLQCALEVARQSGGAYDPTVGHLVDRWGFGPASETRQRPSDQEIVALRESPDWTRLALDVPQLAAYQPGGACLDLSAIAKGFAVDQVARRLEALNVESCLVEIGGELRGHGIKPDGTPWWVRLETPAEIDDGSGMIVALHNLSAATSGDYRRFFQEDGTRYSHTLDPRTGRPIANGVASVTVLHTECILADAYSTAMTVLGAQEGMALASRLQLAARFICRVPGGHEEYLTPTLRAMLE
jgi:thiamine biosynthesis lipoprotein